MYTVMMKLETGMNTVEFGHLAKQAGEQTKEVVLGYWYHKVLFQEKERPLPRQSWDERSLSSAPPQIDNIKYERIISSSSSLLKFLQSQPPMQKTKYMEV